MTGTAFPTTVEIYRFQESMLVPHPPPLKSIQIIFTLHVGMLPETWSEILSKDFWGEKIINLVSRACASLLYLHQDI